MKITNKHTNANGDTEYTVEMQMPIWVSDVTTNEQGDTELTISGAAGLALIVPEVVR